MNKENTLKLKEDFPEFWKNIENIRVSLIGFGFECGDGWFNLIYNLCKDIEEIYDTKQEHFYVEQVKEKFGGLRFYISRSTKEVFELIDKAELESYSTCETCGKEGALHTTNPEGLGGWFKTLCKSCAEKSNKYYLYKSSMPR